MYAAPECGSRGNTMSTANESSPGAAGGGAAGLRAAAPPSTWGLDAAQHRHIVAELRRAVLREGETVGIEGELTVAGSTRPLNFAARVTEASEGAVTLLAELTIGRSDFNTTWNRMGMITGPATVVIVARFTRMADQA